MKKRMVLMLAIVIAAIAIIAGVKYFQIKSAMGQQGSFQPPPEAVTTVVAKTEEWNTTLKAIGTVAAVNGVTVSADLPGVVEEIAFESGRPIGAGDLLVRLDAKQERAQLASAEAARTWTRLESERARDLLAKGIVSQSQYDDAAAKHKQAEARVGEIRATIQRKTIRAPFAGVAGIRMINKGQYLEGGAPIVSLQAVRPAYVNFMVPQQELGGLTVGTPVEVTSDALQGTESGRVTAVDSFVEEATRNVRVQALLDNRSGKLRPGMFVETQLARGARSTVIALPVSAISYAPFGNSVFIVEEIKPPEGKPYRGVRQQFVKLGGSRGDQVAVLTGVKAGEEIVSSGAFKLRNGAAVTVNNTSMPSNNAAPRPEDS